MLQQTRPFVSDNGESPIRHQAIIWTNAGLSLIGPLTTNLNFSSSKQNTNIFINLFKNKTETVVCKIIQDISFLIQLIKQNQRIPITETIHTARVSVIGHKNIHSSASQCLLPDWRTCYVIISMTDCHVPSSLPGKLPWLTANHELVREFFSKARRFMTYDSSRLHSQNSYCDVWIFIWFLSI